MPPIPTWISNTTLETAEERITEEGETRLTEDGEVRILERAEIPANWSSLNLL